MRFVYTTPYGKNNRKKTFIIPAQIDTSLELFHDRVCENFKQSEPEKFEYLSDSTGFFTYFIWREKPTQYEEKTLFAKITKWPIIGKQKNIQKYLGPKGIELLVISSDDCLGKVRPLLNELLKLPITESGEKKVINVSGYSRVIEWYKNKYDTLSDIKKLVDDVFKKGEQY